MGVDLAMYFVYSVCLGSYLCASYDNVQLSRKEGKKPDVWGAFMSISRYSICESCGHRLRGADLIPVVSYLCFRGRCQYCGAVIPGHVFVCETAVGLCGFLWGLEMLNKAIGTLYGMIIFTILSVCICLSIIFCSAGKADENNRGE